MAHVPKLDGGDRAACLKIATLAPLARKGLATAAWGHKAPESSRRARPSFRRLESGAVGPFVEVLRDLLVAGSPGKRRLSARCFRLLWLVRHDAPPSSRLSLSHGKEVLIRRIVPVNN